MQVCAADAAELRRHFDVSGFAFWDGDFFEADVFLAVEADCVHGSHVGEFSWIFALSMHAQNRSKRM